MIERFLMYFRNRLYPKKVSVPLVFVVIVLVLVGFIGSWVLYGNPLGGCFVVIFLVASILISLFGYHSNEATKGRKDIFRFLSGENFYDLALKVVRNMKRNRDVDSDSTQSRSGSDHKPEG